MRHFRELAHRALFSRSLSYRALDHPAVRDDPRIAVEGGIARTLRRSHLAAAEVERRALSCKTAAQDGGRIGVEPLCEQHVEKRPDRADAESEHEDAGHGHAAAQ